METPIQILTRLNIPTVSFIRAALVLGSWEIKTSEFYYREISNLLGRPVELTTSTDKIAHLYFSYYVQETIRVLKHGLIPDMETVWTVAQTKASSFINQHPYVISTKTSEFDADETIKQDWRHIAEQTFVEQKDILGSRRELIAVMVNATGMSQATVASFYGVLKNKYKFVERIDSPVDLNERLQHAERLYTDVFNTLDRNQITNLFITELNVTKSVAVSLFYKCKQKIGSCFQPDEKISKKQIAWERLKQCSKEDLLNKIVICDMLAREFDLPLSSASAYYYQFLKSNVNSKD